MKSCSCSAPPAASASRPCNSASSSARGSLRRHRPRKSAHFAARYGADETIDYTTADWRDTLKALTGGNGPDVIFDPVGGEVALQAFRSIAWRGRHLVVGFASGTIPALAFNLPFAQGRRPARRRSRPDPAARAGDPCAPDRAIVRLARRRPVESHLKDFAKSLSLADKIVLADIYAAREKDPGDISSKDLANELKKLGKEAILFPVSMKLKTFY